MISVANFLENELYESGGGGSDLMMLQSHIILVSFRWFSRILKDFPIIFEIPTKFYT